MSFFGPFYGVPAVTTQPNSLDNPEFNYEMSFFLTLQVFTLHLVFHSRLEKGWQHLQECPETFLNGNKNIINNNNSNPLDFNDNGPTSFHDVDGEETIVPSSYVDGDYRAMSSEEESSSDDESSASYSDTSPLLDVSSLGDNSDAGLDSDMSEDSSTSSSSSSEEDSMLDDCNSNINNNNDDEEEDDEEDMVSMDAPPSMQSSWMSFSSSASTPSLAAGQSSSRDRQVILPDVLPVGKISRGDDDPIMRCDNSGTSTSVVSTRNLEITVEKRRSSPQDSSRMSGDCCLVEIKAQPDVQVDIRVNPMANRPYRESKPVTIKHGNTYPRETKNNKRYLKNRNSNPWIVNDSFEEQTDDGSPKFWTLGEGIRLNNFTIVNGYKTLSLTELVNPNTNEEPETTTMPVLDSEIRNSGNSKRGYGKTTSSTTSTLTNAYQNFERNYSKLPANVHMCCKDNWRFQRDSNNASALKKKTNVEDSTINKCNSALQKTDIESFPTRAGSQKSRNVAKEMVVDKPKQNTPTRLSGIDDNSNKLVHTEKLPPKPKEVGRKEPTYYSAKGKSGDSKLSSPELFEVYTMETAVPHINWAAISKSSRESDWIRKVRHILAIKPNLVCIKLNRNIQKLMLNN